MKIKSCIFGASGYAGVELISLLLAHPEYSLEALFVSENSADAGKTMGELYPQRPVMADWVLQAGTQAKLKTMAEEMDVIFLATPHEFSHDIMPLLTSGKARVMDLSGAFRIKDRDIFASHYGFTHQHQQLLEQAVYGLVDWHADALAGAKVVAVPGCYPTASLLALKPLFENQLLDSQVRPVINAVSGVSGAGRKAALNSSFCEVSLQAYGVLSHRHQPEIESWLGTPVIFTPHLGNFKRGILATITVKLNAGVTQQQIDDAFNQAYANNPQIQLRKTFPKVEDVVNTGRCDLGWKYDSASGYLVICSAIDNLLKGAASQALQCANLSFGLDKNSGLPL
ncbi:N-acetyl-gamma-glutamyl-phosphate reductase [Neptunicella sp.]|uniref:N-acetyl-gamma-glutamyl-phosphate reductase n=1 Tax=Neptunicella sp. TaxID=2125986 RepID=UPI003F68BDAD